MVMVRLKVRAMARVSKATVSKHCQVQHVSSSRTCFRRLLVKFSMAPFPLNTSLDIASTGTCAKRVPWVVLHCPATWHDCVTASRYVYR